MSKSEERRLAILKKGKITKKGVEIMEVNPQDKVPTPSGMIKVVVNKCYGGFGLSAAAVQRYFKLKGKKIYIKELKSSIRPYEAYYSKDLKGDCFYDGDLKRDDPYLVKAVEELGEKASGQFAELHVVEVPADAEWEIAEYDGQEWVAEKHRTW